MCHVEFPARIPLAPSIEITFDPCASGPARLFDKATVIVRVGWILYRSNPRSLRRWTYDSRGMLY